MQRIQSSRSRFCSHFPCIWRGFRPLAGNILPRAGRTVYELRSGEHTRHGCCWTRLASSLLHVRRTQKFWKFRCVHCFPRGRGKPHPRRVRSPSTSEFRFSPAFIRKDQSARRRLERPGRSRSPFFIESFRLGKKDALSTRHGRSGTSVPRNLCAAVKLRKGIRPVMKTGLSSKQRFENPT